MRITIKVGSNVLTRPDGTLNVERMEHLVAEIAELHKAGHKVIFVSSGAMAAGRTLVKNYSHLEPVAQRQLLSSIGQVKLIDQYKRIFDCHNIFIGQILVTKQDFRTREHYLNMKSCIHTLWENGVIPVVNENDAISVTGLMFTDNDELSGLMASMMDCDKLFILSNVDGIFDGNPADEGTKVIREIGCRQNVSKYMQVSKSSFGRGGMQTKCHSAQKTAASGIDVYIANGTRDGVITNLANGNPDFVSTHFIAGERIPAVKKWIAYSEGFTKAEVVVNEGAKNALLSHKKAASLLFSGIVTILGEFKAKDLLTIRDEAGTYLGVGCSTMDSDKARAHVGAHNLKPLIHYDYLYIDNDLI